MITYGHEIYIRQAIDSILMQKVSFKYEIIIGEDKSPDNTRDVLLEYKVKYPEIFNLLLRDENLGPTMNSYDVFMKCKGKYIAILEGDDYWTDPFKLTKQVEFLEQHQEYIGVAHKFNTVNKSGIIINNLLNMTTFKNVNYNMKNFLNNIFPLQIATLLFKNIFLETNNKYEIIYQASPVVGDITLVMVLLDMSDIFIMGDNMSAYRYVNEIGGTNCSSIPIQKLRFNRIEQTFKLENYFHNKYSMSKWRTVNWVGLALLLFKDKNKPKRINQALSLLKNIKYKDALFIIMFGLKYIIKKSFKSGLLKLKQYD